MQGRSSERSFECVVGAENRPLGNNTKSFYTFYTKTTPQPRVVSEFHASEKAEKFGQK